MPYLIQYPEGKFLKRPTETGNPCFVARENADEYGAIEAAEEHAKRHHGMVIDAETGIVLSDYTEREAYVDFQDDGSEDDEAVGWW